MAELHCPCFMHHCAKGISLQTIVSTGETADLEARKVLALRGTNLSFSSLARGTLVHVAFFFHPFDILDLQGAQDKEPLRNGELWTAANKDIYLCPVFEMDSPL